MKTVELQMYGRPEQRATVEVEEGACAYCIFVGQNVRMTKLGETCFVHLASEPTRSIRQVEVVAVLGGRVGVKCQAVSEAEVVRELREARERRELSGWQTTVDIGERGWPVRYWWSDEQWIDVAWCEAQGSAAGVCSALNAAGAVPDADN